MKFEKSEAYKLEDIKIKERDLKGLKFLAQYKLFLSKYGAANYYGLIFFELNQLKHYHYEKGKAHHYLTETTPIAIDPLNNYLCLMKKYGASYDEVSTKLMFANNHWRRGIPIDCTFDQFLENYKTNELNQTSHTREFFSNLHDGIMANEFVEENEDYKIYSKILRYIKKIFGKSDHT